MKKQLNPLLRSNLITTFNSLLLNTNIRYISYKRLVQHYFRLGFFLDNMEDVTFSRVASAFLEEMENKNYIRLSLIRQRRKFYEFIDRTKVFEDVDS